MTWPFACIAEPKFKMGRNSARNAVPRYPLRRPLKRLLSRKRRSNHSSSLLRSSRCRSSNHMSSKPNSLISRLLSMGMRNSINSPINNPERGNHTSSQELNHNSSSPTTLANIPLPLIREASVGAFWVSSFQSSASFSFSSGKARSRKAERLP